MASEQEQIANLVATVRRGAEYGWVWEPVSANLKRALLEASWSPPLSRYVIRCHAGGWAAPNWLLALVDSLVPMYLVKYPSGQQLMRVQTDFLSMIVSWSAAGRSDALEKRAKPLASVIGLGKDIRDVHLRVNHFINEQGY